MKITLSSLTLMFYDKLESYNLLRQTTKVSKDIPLFYEKINLNFIFREMLKLSSLWNFFYGNLGSDKIKYTVTLMESLLLCDGLICSLIFIKNTTILNLITNLTNSAANDKIQKTNFINKKIIEKYNNIYILDVFDRYLLYLVLTCFTILLPQNTQNFLSVFALPIIQNSIFKIPYINKKLKRYVKNKEIFLKYSLSKLTVNFIEQLHISIVPIPNYHIFIIYNTLSLSFLVDICKNILFLTLLYILRNNAYIYYKSVKLIYYNNVGFLFNIIPIKDACYLINVVIKEKRWYQLNKIEVINAFYTLILNKYNLLVLNSVAIDIKLELQLIMCKIFSLYTVVSLVKTIYNNVTSLCFIILMLLYTLTTLFYTIIPRLRKSKFILIVIINLLIIFNINDLIITVIIISNNVINYWLEEIIFFILNINNVRKVLKVYGNTINKSEDNKIDKIDKIDKIYEKVVF